MDTAIKTRKTIRFRGRSFLALVLAPEHPLDEWFAEFDGLRDRSPSFFINRPVVLDVSPLGLDKKGLETLVADLFARRVRVMGVEGAKASALGLGLPPALSGGRLVEDMPAPEEETKPAEADTDASAPAEPAPPALPAPVPSLVIETPVRSGQSIMFPEGDVTVIGSIASGAEVVAGGSIHVYGALRGRALAGFAGNASARIFCRKFEAELIAVDGLYQTADELDPELHGRPIQIWLDGDSIMMAALD
ncbi:MAG TPA: septum site-determining protein MinC [Methylomirabilota bacterium]|nr:septum site-determining protein MinC [Methylomirabilota bacterium]